MTLMKLSVTNAVSRDLCLCCSQINPGTVGFYRIQYSSSMLESLMPGIRDLTLQPVDRLGLQNDLFSLVSHEHTHTHTHETKCLSVLVPRTIEKQLMMGLVNNHMSIND